MKSGRHRQFNKTSIHEEGYVVVDISTTKRPNEHMMIDASDWAKLLEMGIGRVSKHKKGWASTRINGTPFTVHRLIFPFADSVDHANHNRLDNRRSNIRPCSNRQNSQNRSIRSDNTTGCTGVNKIRNKWRAGITYNGKRLSLGVYCKIEEAITARKVAEKLLFGEFRYDNNKK